MIKRTFGRQESGLFSALSNELTYTQEQFADLIQTPFSTEAFQKQIQDKKVQYSNQSRMVLHATLVEQYQSVEHTPETRKNIELLAQENTFTITTGHQLNIFTGPLYFIYKIIHVINLSEKLKVQYPDNNIVPVYWMATEDHDFEEINHTTLFNKKIAWEEYQGGAVGEYSLRNWELLIEQVQSLFGEDKTEVSALLAAYNGKNLSQATFHLVHHLMGKYGLLIVEPNHKNLKELFAPVMLQEVAESTSLKEITETNKIIEARSYKPQVYAREINLFYLSDHARDRVVLQEDGQLFIQGLGVFSRSEVQDLIRQNPERFSPNVCLRPVYQEVVLPNLLYVGGGGEMAYWIQLKRSFDAFGVLYPLIQVRASLQIIDGNTQKKIEKLNFDTATLFEDSDAIKRKFVTENASEELNFNQLEQDKVQLLQTIEQQILALDPTLSNFAEAEKVKLNKQIDQIQEKLIKQQKNKMEQSMKQIDDVKAKLFPNGGVQERNTNFLHFCAQGHVAAFIDEIKEMLDPLEKDLIILTQI